MNREDLAWAASFFDGEGSVGCQFFKTRGYKQRKLSVSIGQVHRQVLDKFKNAVGGLGGVYDCKNPSGFTVKSQRIFRYQAGSFQDAQAIMAMLWPWLSSIKREQTKRALARYHGGLV